MFVHVKKIKKLVIFCSLNYSPLTVIIKIVIKNPGIVFELVSINQPIAYDKNQDINIYASCFHIHVIVIFFIISYIFIENRYMFQQIKRNQRLHNGTTVSIGHTEGIFDMEGTGIMT